MRRGKTVLAMVLVLALPRWAHATPGDLDPTFGVGGVVTTRVGTRDGKVNALAIQPDGKIVAAGYGINSASNPSFPNDGLALVRYGTDGSLDATWGVGGIAGTPLGTFKSFANAVALQPDGKVVAAGVAHPGSVSGTFGLARFDTDGALDPSFGTAGTVATPIGSLAVAHAVAIQPDGRIVAAGYAGLGGEFQIAVARYLTDGNLDASFGGDGIVTVAYGNNYGNEVGMTLQPDGKIVVAGAAQQIRYVLFRFASDGTLDPGFGTAGKVTANVGSGGPRAVVVQPDGKIVAAGYSRASATFEDFGLLRLLNDGSLDASFGTGGIATTSFGPMADQGYGTALQSDGKILVAGFMQGLFGVARYTAGGALDASFGGTGWVSGNLSGFGQRAHAVAVQADGRIVAGGWHHFGGGTEFAVVRYLGDEAPLPTSTPTATMTPAPDGCGALPNPACRKPWARSSTILLKDHVTDGRDRLTWKWTRGAATTPSDFGDPTVATDYRLCVYDTTGDGAALIASADIPAGDTCGGAPCWRATTRGFRYRDKVATPDGIVSLVLSAGAEGRSQITLSGVGAALDIPSLPLAQATTVVVQLENDVGVCWGADFSSPALRNTSSDFRDRSD